MNKERLEYTFLWFVENYSYCWHKNGERLYSPFFVPDELENKYWVLVLFPRGNTVQDKGCISLALGVDFEDDGPEEVTLNYKVSILAPDGSDRFSFVDKAKYQTPFLCGRNRFAKNEIFPQDTLAIRCRVWTDGEEVRRIPPMIARTRIGIENISFSHVVENFSTLARNQKKTIEVRPSPSKLECGLVSSVYFTDESCLEGELTVEITPAVSNHVLCKRKISLVDCSGNIIGCGEEDNRLDDERKDIHKLPLSLTRQDFLNKKSDYLPNDTLTLLCECSISTGPEFERIEETQHETEIADLNTITSEEDTPVRVSAYPSGWDEIKSLYGDQCLSDVKLKTATKSFPAHKIMLCARFAVFKAMLTNDMKEKNADCIQVDDLADDVVEKFLLFLYSDDVENLHWSTATELYYAADKNQIGKLKELCSSFLVDNLTTSTACELLVLADKHSDSKLKKTVEDFILENDKEVFNSKEWEMFMETNPLLALKTIHLKYKR